MLTTEGQPVNAPPAAVMRTIGQIAEAEKVSTAAVSRMVKRLRKQHGLMVALDARGHVTGVNVAQYEELRGKHGDPSKAQAPKSGQETEATNDSYDEALRIRTWVEAERAKLKLAAEQGLYVPVDQLSEALTLAAEEIVRRLDVLPNAADDLAAALSQEGVRGLRIALKKIGVELRTEIADALAGCIGRPS